MNKGKSFLTQGLLVYIIANCLSKSSFTIKTVAYVVLIIFCSSTLIRAIREKSLKVDVFALTSLIVFLIYSFGGVIAKQFTHKYIYIYDSGISWVIRVLFALMLVISFGFYGYQYVDVDSRDIWLKYIKILSIIFLIILSIIGVLYIMFP